MRRESLDIKWDNLVYPPSEDTFLLADAINLNQGEFFIEIGCGSGFVSLTAAMIARSVIAVDISLDAVRTTKKNALENGLYEKCQILQSNLFGAIGVSAIASVIAFNPPYLPADGETTELDNTLIGGRTGVELAIQFVDQAIPHLALEGKIYLVVSSLADEEKLKKHMQAKSLITNSVAKKKLFFEYITVLEGILS